MNGGVIIPDEDTARALNDLARHKAIVRILNDIRMDMEICEIEGWDKNEYLNLLKQLLNSIGDKTMGGTDTISRQAAIDCVTYDVEHTIECLKALSSAQPERKKGQWLRYGEDGYPNNEDTVFWQCDQCLEQYTGRAKKIPNFCPNCGADMRGGDK